jgi:hypothetical protein
VCVVQCIPPRNKKMKAFCEHALIAIGLAIGLHFIEEWKVSNRLIESLNKLCLTWWKQVNRYAFVLLYVSHIMHKLWSLALLLHIST